jgi:hypothetical protein
MGDPVAGAAKAATLAVLSATGFWEHLPPPAMKLGDGFGAAAECASQHAGQG